jgi:hypothetical protein
MDSSVAHRADQVFCPRALLGSSGVTGKGVQMAITRGRSNWEQKLCLRLFFNAGQQRIAEDRSQDPKMPTSCSKGCARGYRWTNSHGRLGYTSQGDAAL